MNKPGFTLVEILLASAIAAVLSGLLFAVVSQLNRSIPIIDRRADTYEKASMVNAQLERDLSGVSAPNEFYARQKLAQKDKPQEQSSSDQKKNDEQKKSAEDKKAKETAESSSTEEAAKKPLEKIFYSTNKDGMFEQLSFITTNPLQIYWGGKAGSAKPRVARVLYALQEEKNPRKNAKKSYRLVRQESPTLDWDQFKSNEGIKEYTLSDNIRSMQVEFSAVLIPQEKGKEAKPAETNAAKGPTKKEIQKKKDWSGKIEDESQGDKSASAKKLPLTPQLAQFDIVFWDEKQQRSTPFSFAIRIPAELEEKRTEGPALLEKLKTLVGHTTTPSQQQQKPSMFAQQQKPMFNFSSPRLGP
jgi:prepilin-type N-terminal cleavage/methylation domain-containing protein